MQLAQGRELERAEDVAVRDSVAGQFLCISFARAEATLRKRMRTIAMIASGSSLALVIALVAAGIAVNRNNEQSCRLPYLRQPLRSAIFGRRQG